MKLELALPSESPSLTSDTLPAQFLTPRTRSLLNTFRPQLDAGNTGRSLPTLALALRNGGLAPFFASKLVGTQHVAISQVTFGILEVVVQPAHLRLKHLEQNVQVKGL